MNPDDSVNEFDNVRAQLLMMQDRLAEVNGLFEDTRNRDARHIADHNLREAKEHLEGLTRSCETLLGFIWEN